MQLRRAGAHLVVQFDASLGDDHLELSFQGADGPGQLGSLVAGSLGHSEVIRQLRRGC